MKKNYTLIDLSKAEGYDNKTHWNYYKDDFSYSGHRNFGSPFECDDDCGTCDGARCDYCRKIYHEPSFGISYDWLEEAIKKAGFSDEVAEAACTELGDDFGSWPYFKSNGKEYKVVTPNWWELDDEAKAKLADELDVDEEFR